MSLAKSVAVIWQAVVEVLQQQFLLVRGLTQKLACAQYLFNGKRWCMFRVGAL